MIGSAAKNRLRFHPCLRNKDTNFKLLRHLSSSTHGSSLTKLRNVIKLPNSSYHSSGMTLDADKSDAEFAEADFISRHINKMSPFILCHVQYHTMMDYYVKKGDVDSVEHIMAEMDRHGVPPNMITINKLLSTYIARKDGQGAREVMKNLKLHGITPNAESIGILMNAYAAAQDYAATDKILQKVVANGRELDTKLMNDVMRTNVLSKNPIGAESVLSGIYEMELLPDKVTLDILMQAYASVGDINGTKNVLEKNVQLGFDITTALVNNILSAIVECPILDHWNEVLQCHEKYFESGLLVPDEQTCIQSLLACAKYERPDEALLWFENFAKSGLKMSTDVRRAFRSAVGQVAYDQHPMIFSYDSQHLMTVMDNYMLYLQSVKPIEKPYQKVIDGERVRDLLQKIKGVAADSKILNSLVMACIDIGDLKCAVNSIKQASLVPVYPDAFTMYLLIGAHASHGDYRAAEEAFSVSNDSGVSVRDATVMNQIIRSYAVAGNVKGAEEAFKTLPYLSVTPNFESFQFMLMNYSNVGDFAGVELTIAAMTEASFRATTSCRNFTLKAFLHERNTSGWEAFESCYLKYFGSDELKKDTITYTLILLACQKYDRVDDALAIFGELLSSGEEIAPIVKNIFRQLIDSDELRHLYPNLSDSWEPEEAGIHMTKGADLKTNYQEIWSGTVKSINRGTIQNVKPIIRKQPHHLVCGVDIDEKARTVYGGDIETVKRRMYAIGTPVREHTLVEYMKLAGKAGDADGVYTIFMEQVKYGLRVTRPLLVAMSQAFSSNGNHEGAMKIFKMAKEAKLSNEWFYLNEVLRAYSNFGDAKGAKKILDLMDEMKMRPGQESLHLVMMTYVSVGDLQKCKWTLSTLKDMKFHPNTTTINILLAGHLYSSDTFNERDFTDCYSKHFVHGDLEPDRFTYTQLLLACEKCKSPFDAAVYFNKFLKTKLRITVAMKNSLLNALGDEYPKYVATLSETNRKLLENVEVIEHSMKSKKVEVIVPGAMKAYVPKSTL